MRPSLSEWFTDRWYRNSCVSIWLLPLSLIYSGIVRFRKMLYGLGLLKRETLSVPVIIVGNITVGGTGKTPLIIWLAQFLKEAGYQPGIISRGYGGRSQHWPQRVTKHSDPALVGDEALLIASLTDCPVAVAPIRAEAGNLLIDQAQCNVILSDDGLQHYALKRDIEIAVIDGARRFGNGHCLPAGPLREPVARLSEADAIVVNGEKTNADEFCMHMEGNIAVNLVTGQKKPLREFAQGSCHAVAGIGNPERFFRQLEAEGLGCQTHAFPDHHPYLPINIDFDDDSPVFMTEKDAVKCREFATERHWSVPVVAVPESGFSERIIKLLREKHGR